MTKDHNAQINDGERMITDKTEIGWLIERYTHSKLEYWTGKQDDFSPDNLKAIRFARAWDATVMLTWHLNGNGRVAEHVWVAK